MNDDLRAKRRARFGYWYLMLVLVMTCGIGYLWYSTKAVPPDLGTIIGIIAGGIMTGLHAIIKSMYPEETAQTPKDKDDSGADGV